MEKALYHRLYIRKWKNKIPVHSYVVHGLLAYDETWQALAANLPKNSVIAHIHTSFFKKYCIGFEYRHDWDYSSEDTANGSTEAHPDNETIFGTGKTRNIYLLQVGVYF